MEGIPGESECEQYMHCMRTLETAREIGGESAHERQQKITFPREGRLWNFCGTHRIHKRFLTRKVDSQLQSRIRRHVPRPLSILLLCSA